MLLPVHGIDGRYNPLWQALAQAGRLVEAAATQQRRRSPAASFQCTCSRPSATTVCEGPVPSEQNMCCRASCSVENGMYMIQVLGNYCDACITLSFWHWSFRDHARFSRSNSSPRPAVAVSLASGHAHKDPPLQVAQLGLGAVIGPLPLQPVQLATNSSTSSQNLRCTPRLRRCHWPTPAAAGPGRRRFIYSVINRRCTP